MIEIPLEYKFYSTTLSSVFFRQSILIKKCYRKKMLTEQ